MTLLRCSSVSAELHQSLMSLLRGLAVVLCLVLLPACTTLPDWTFDARDIPPLKFEGERYVFEPSRRGRRRENILATSEDMRAFVERNTGEANNPTNKLMALHRAIKGQGGLAIEYDPFADGDAQGAFERGSANCLSYAHMFIALAREAGLNARYQWMEVRPEWHRMGDRVAVRLHVNVQVKTRDGTEYMVDIDPLNRSEVAGTRLMSDAEGLGLYYNNKAMNALADDRPVDAWKQLTRGLEVASGLSQLWVNLGAIYRLSGQYAEAEQSYFHALEIDQADRSAINNLVVLYELQGREQERGYWLDRLARYRDLNPYYHASLGEQAMAEEDWEGAYDHYKRAQRLQPEDGQLLYSLGLAAYKLGDFREAGRLIERAIERASFQLEKARYRVELLGIREEQRAAQL